MNTTLPTPTVLLVDDTPINLETLRSVLTISGINVLVAENGKQALRQASDSLPDLIVMDVMMPDMDGFEACRKLKQQEGTKDIPVIFITSLIDQSSTLEGFAAGGVDYITKPFNQHETLARVQTHLALRQLRKELETKNAVLLEEVARRKQAEEERRNLEAQLRQSQRLEALGTLAGGIAHDFNNILGTIQGYAEFLLSKLPQSSAEKTYVERIFTAGERATSLVKRLLTFSRAHEQHLVPTNLAPVIEEALQMLRATLPATIKIVQHIQPDCSPVLADTAQIHQIVVNLCINAGQAMQTGGGELEVSLEEVSSPPTDVVLAICDTGCGMTPDVRERIFDPFFTTRATESGTGLGLSVVHGIVKGHHGTMQVESTPGTGTTVRILFPATCWQTTSETPAPAASTAEGKGGILIVDDEADLADIFRMALTEVGYQVFVCHNGAEALDLFRAWPDNIDLVFTDQTMPGMDGAHLCRELLSIKPELPIILVTGYSDRVSPAEAASIGIRHFLTKPVRIRQVLELVQRLLG